MYAIIILTTVGSSWKNSVIVREIKTFHATFELSFTMILEYLSLAGLFLLGCITVVHVGHLLPYDILLTPYWWYDIAGRSKFPTLIYDLSLKQDHIPVLENPQVKSLLIGIHWQPIFSIRNQCTLYNLTNKPLSVFLLNHG